MSITIAEPPPKYEKKVTAIKGAAEVGKVGGVLYASHLLAGALAVGVPATAPFEPFIAGGFATAILGIWRCIRNWRNQRNLGKKK